MITHEIKLWEENMRISSDQNLEFITQVVEYMEKKLEWAYASDATLVNTQTAWKRTSFLITAELFLALKQLSSIDEKVKKIESIIAFT